MAGDDVRLVGCGSAALRRFASLLALSLASLVPAQVTYYGNGQEQLKVVGNPNLTNRLTFTAGKESSGGAVFVFGTGSWLRAEICPGRVLYVAPWVQVPTAGVLTLPVPDDPWLIGRVVKVQYVRLHCIPPFCSCAQLRMSNAAAIRVMSG